MRTLVLPLLPLLLVAASCTSSTTSHDAGVDATLGLDAGADATIRDSGPIYDADVCGLPTFDRTCTVREDCINAIHLADCCGTERPLGISRSERERFDAFESACIATYPDCGCAAMYPTADDGTTTTSMQSAAEATLQCLAGVCTTTYAP